MAGAGGDMDTNGPIQMLSRCAKLAFSGEGGVTVCGREISGRDRVPLRGIRENLVNREFYRLCFEGGVGSRLGLRLALEGAMWHGRWAGA